jgi:hypothetical protein
MGEWIGLALAGIFSIGFLALVIYIMLFFWLPIIIDLICGRF